ncbi:MAG: NAD(P)/FAD-dependent oxidoreductase [Chloroflexi bacterium]|nr:NAD(P)/FAD-dependent oxidoreductase [Chloroflexota bacterium]
MADCDILVVGAGHNALVCAGYLAQAGYKVIVLERRHKAGGAVVTEEIIPGFKFDLGGSAHILIHHTPIVRDLELTRYGLEYIDLDPLFFAPFPDGKHFTIWKDVDKTCESIAAISPREADNYRRFINRWKPMGEGMVGAFLNAPTPLNLTRYLVFAQGFSRKGAENLQDLIRGYGQVLRQSFDAPYVPALIGWMAAQSGPPPTEPLSAPFALWHPMYHASGVKRPRGGSGMLTQALQKMIEAHGGQVRLSTPVARFLVERGRVVGVETADGDMVTAGRAVVSGAHLFTTVKMLGDDAPPAMQQAVKTARIGNGFGMIVRAAVSELPNYTAKPTATSGTAPGFNAAPQHVAMQFMCPDLDYLERAYGDFLGGRPSAEPGVIAMTWTASDPTLAPEGKHVLFMWSQYAPYQLSTGEHWDDIAEREAEKILGIVRRYAPNMTRDKVIGWLIETPLYLERELGLLRGNVMHLEMSVDQMFLMRPSTAFSNYRAPLKGLYLTGASTHPGGGIMGSAGRNAAAALLHDLERKKI